MWSGFGGELGCEGGDDSLGSSGGDYENANS